MLEARRGSRAGEFAGRLLLLGSLILAGFGSRCAGLEAVPDVPPPKHWDGLVYLPWQHQTDVTKDKALYESVNLRGFHIDRKSDTLQAFAKDTQWPFYVDHAAGKGYLHLGKKGDAIKRKKDIVVRPNSLADPATIEAMKKLVAENVNSAKGSSVVAYALDDEISTGGFASPVETDGHPNSIAGYRKFLEETYGDIGRLNAQYGTSYKGFGEIEPKSFEAFRAQLKPDSLGKANLSQWCDWRSYMDTQFAECLAGMVRFANGLDPNTPAGCVGLGCPAAYGGYDYRKLCKVMQWMEAYDIGGSNEIIRSFWTQKRPRVNAFFASKDAKKDAWFHWYYLAHGVRGFIGWPEGWFKDGQVADFITALAKTFKEIQGPVSKLIVDGEFVHDPVAIYYSQPSIQMTWAMDSVCHGGTWPNRSSSMENSISTSAKTRIAWIKTLEDIGIQAKFVHQDHLLGGDLEKGGFKVLLLDRTMCLSDAEAAAIKAFAGKGGTVIADYLCGVFDEHGKARSAGALDDLFGVKRDLAKGVLGGGTLTEINGEKGESFSEKSWDVQGAGKFRDAVVYERGLTADGEGKALAESSGAAVGVRRGKAVYLNLSPVAYLLKRPDNSAKEWLPFVAGLLKDAGVEPRLTLTVGGAPAAGTESLFWKNGARTTLCIVRNIDRAATISTFGDAKAGFGEAAVKLKLSFASPVKGLRNERTGKDLGDGKEFEEDFTPWEANVYTYAQ